jgi:hypothetical protein
VPHRSLAVLIPLALMAFSNAPAAERLPSRVGACVDTHIKSVGARLMDGPDPVEDSGVDVEFTNGARQVSYEHVPQAERSRPGDPVRMCLLETPRDCPPGDDRGRLYRTTNLRTRQTWVLRDSEHICGGA